MAQAMLRLLARPKITATRPSRLFAIYVCAPERLTRIESVFKGYQPAARTGNSLAEGRSEEPGVTRRCEDCHIETMERWLFWKTGKLVWWGKIVKMVTLEFL